MSNEDINRLKLLSGIELKESQVNEIVDKADLTEYDDVINRLVHCKKALAIANTLPDPADRKKWQGRALGNLNRVRAALKKLTDQLTLTVDDRGNIWL